MADVWLNINSSCCNCGRPLQARWDPTYGGFTTIKGFGAIEYRHQDKTTECIIRKTPRAYDDWIGNKQLKQAEALENSDD